MDNIRIGIIGLGNNCRDRHVPGLRACAGVEIVGVVNRRPASTASVAQEFGIPRTYDNWQQLVADDNIDAVVIGTWPYLHCPITLAALEAGKHVMTEARMAMNAAEAHQMHGAGRQHADLVAQIVPSPIGFSVDRVVKQMIADGYLGQLRQVVVIGTSDLLAAADSPLTWRQTAEYSGTNVLLMGIIHETLIRWVPDPVRVFAQTHAFTPQRPDPQTGKLIDVGTPDSVEILTLLPDGARAIYHLSGAIHFGPGVQIHLYGSEGAIKFLLDPHEHVLAGRRGESQLREVAIPADKAYAWRVEQEFIDAIQGTAKIEFTDFATGVRYMEFTEAVARSAQTGQPVDLPLVM